MTLKQVIQETANTGEPTWLDQIGVVLGFFTGPGHNHDIASLSTIIKYL